MELRFGDTGAEPVMGDNYNTPKDPYYSGAGQCSTASVDQCCQQTTAGPADYPPTYPPPSPPLARVIRDEIYRLEYALSKQREKLALLEANPVIEAWERYTRLS